MEDGTRDRLWKVPSRRGRTSKSMDVSRSLGVEGRERVKTLLSSEPGSAACTMFTQTAVLVVIPKQPHQQQL